MKANILIPVALAIAVSSISTSCVIVKKGNGSYGPTVTNTINITDFNAIESTYIGDITYTQGPASCKVTGPKNILDEMTFEVKDSVLIISGYQGSINNDIEDIDIVCSSSALRYVNNDGIGDFEWKGGNAGDLRLVINGLGDIKWENGRCNSLTLTINGMGSIECDDITGNALHCRVDGMGDIDISGTFRTGNLVIGGMGDIDIHDLKCDDLHTSIDGMGSIKGK